LVFSEGEQREPCYRCGGLQGSEEDGVGFVAGSDQACWWEGGREGRREGGKEGRKQGV